MEINLAQIFMQGLGTGVGAGFAAIISFLVMRYFPKFLEGVERIIKALMKPDVKLPDKEDGHEKGLLA